MKKIIIISMLISSINAFGKSADRQTAKGYFKKDSKKRIFFIRQPGTLEPGIQVQFENTKAEEMVCVLRKPLPIECPLQTVSFIPKKEANRLVMDNAHLTEASTAWHKLRSAELTFGIQRQPSKKR